MATKDIKIQNRCDHRVLLERISLDSDRLTLSPAYPIGSRKGMELLRYGKLVSPNKYTFRRKLDNLYLENYFEIELLMPDMSSDPLYELNYNVPLEFCPKCLGTQFTDDLGFNDVGELGQVSGALLLIQSVEKAIITSKGTNKYYTWVGTNLKSYIGTKIAEFSILSQEIETQVRSSLETLRNNQIAHQELNPFVSSDEVLDSIETVDVTQDNQDPSVVRIYVEYTSQSGNPYDYTQLMDLTQYRPR